MNQKEEARRSLPEGKCLILLIFLAAAVFLTCVLLINRHLTYNVYREWQPDDAGFRAMEVQEEALSILKENSRETGIPLWSLLAVALVESRGQVTKEAVEGNWVPERYGVLADKISPEMAPIENAMAAVWADVKYFPVPLALANEKATVSYENSWMNERTYGGERGHEGTDVMASVDQQEYYPVISMTDGVVEKVGWLKLGGYRIGIRGDHGGYFYYAHLSSYSEDFQPGDRVSAGDLLGKMGSTGYSETEGTSGLFPVHLHVGIYLNDDTGREISVNPYYILRSLETSKKGYYY